MTLESYGVWGPLIPSHSGTDVTHLGLETWSHVLWLESGTWLHTLFPHFLAKASSVSRRVSDSSFFVSVGQSGLLQGVEI